MPKPINNFMPADLEFQMFVLDELADELIAQGADVLKLTIGVPELFMPAAAYGESSEGSYQCGRERL